MTTEYMSPRYGKYFYCTRMRLYYFLYDKGIIPESSIPDKHTKYTNWMYRTTPELDAALNEYFTDLTVRNITSKK